MRVGRKSLGVTNVLDVGIVCLGGKCLRRIVLERDGGRFTGCSGQTLDVHLLSRFLCLLLLLGVLLHTTDELESALAVSDVLNAMHHKQSNG